MNSFRRTPPHPRALRLMRGRLARLAGVAAGVVLATMAVNGFGANDRRLATLAAAYGLLVLSLVVLTGFAGQVSFVQAQLAGVGALVTGWLVANMGWSFWAAAPVAVAASVIVGVVVGLPALRLQGLILGVVTLALALGFDAYLFTLGPFGKGFTLARPALPGLNLADDRITFAVCLAVLLLAALAVANLRRSGTGRLFAAVRDSEVAARTAGVDVTRLKLTAFAVSAGLAGLAGVLLALTVGSVEKQSFGLLFSINITAVATLMGTGMVGSAIAGGLFLAFGGQVLNLAGLDPQYFNIVLGAGLIAQLIAAPEGLLPRIGRLAAAVRAKRAGALNPAASPMVDTNPATVTP